MERTRPEMAFTGATATPAPTEKFDSSFPIVSKELALNNLDCFHNLKIVYELLGIPEPMALGQAAKDYLAKTVNPTLLKGLTELCKKKPQDPVVSINLWKHMCFQT